MTQLRTRFAMKAAVILAVLMLPAAGLLAGGPHKSLKEIAAGDHRGENNKARDKYRNPVKTLEFFGIKPNMTVVEIWPGGGWYTEILAPYLKDHGSYIAAGYNQEPEGQYADYVKRANARLKKMFDDRAEVFGKVKITELDPPKKMAVAPAGSADMVLTFRNVHNWMPEKADGAFEAFFAALKPGGVLGVVEHRGNAKVKQDPEAGSGYVNQDYVIKMAEKAGFKLAAKSEINANTSDTKDYEKGVWTLPPRFALDDKDKDKYRGIGESDRMTLKFVKPR